MEKGNTKQKIVRRTLWRAYDTANKQWLDHNEMVRRSMFVRADGVLTNGQNVIPMQFVGRSDILGKLIYEGDICEVSVPMDFGDFKSYQKFYSVIIWSDLHMGFINHVQHKDSASIPPQQVASNEMQMKIVGNVIDTPHLLHEMPKV